MGRTCSLRKPLLNNDASIICMGQKLDTLIEYTNIMWAKNWKVIPYDTQSWKICLKVIKKK